MQFYEGMEELNSQLKNSLNTLYSSTITNPLDSNQKCSFTISTLGKLDLNFLGLESGNRYPNYLKKILRLTQTLGDINAIFLKLIDDLQCCQLYDMYNKHIFPIMEWVLGKEKSNGEIEGFLPTLVKINREISIVYETLKTIENLVRPVPGNPWLKSGGQDWLKYIYQPLNELEYIMNEFFDGTYLDIILNPLTDFRNTLFDCAGQKNNLLQYSTYESLDSSTALDKNDLIYQFLGEIKNQKEFPKLSLEYKELQNEKSKLLTEYNQLIALQLKNSYKVIDLRIQFDNLKNTKITLEKKLQEAEINNNDYLKNDLNIKLDDIVSSIFNIELEIDKLINDNIKLENIYKPINKKIEDLNSKINIQEEIYKNKVKNYYETLNNQEILNKRLQDCSLASRIFAAHYTNLYNGTCLCLEKVINISVPKSETIEIKGKESLSKLVGRLPYNFKELALYKKKEHEPITLNNVYYKFQEVPILKYGPSWRVGSFFSEAEYKPYFTRIDKVKNLEEAVLLHEELNHKIYPLFNTQVKLKADNNTIINKLSDKLNYQKIEILDQLERINKNYSILNNIKNYNNNELIEKRRNLQNDLLDIEDLLSNPVADYLILKKESKYLTGSLIGILETNYNKIKENEEKISAYKKIQEFNTRYVSIMSQEQIPCDCNIICKIIQHFIDLLISTINALINRIITALLNTSITKEISYIIKFISVKLKAINDLNTLKDRLNYIKEQSDNIIKNSAARKAEKPYFCNDNELSDVSGISTYTVIDNEITESIIDDIIKYTHEGNTFGEIPVDYNYEITPYPNTFGELKPLDPNEYNDNKLVIDNIQIGEQYKFRTIPTMYFDCDVPEDQRPKFDIITKNIPETWSIYLAFQVDTTKLQNFNQYETITQNDNIIPDNIYKFIKDNHQDLNIENIENIKNPLDDINITSYIEQAQLLYDNMENIYKKEVEECSPDQVNIKDTFPGPCQYKDFIITNIEIIDPKNELNINLEVVNNNEDNNTNYINLQSIDGIEKFNIPIKITFKKIFDNMDDSQYEFQNEESSVILLLDIYDSAKLSNYLYVKDYTVNNMKDISLLLGRYPYLEIGYKDINDLTYRLENIEDIGNTTLLYINFNILKHYIQYTLDNYKSSRAELYELTEDELNERKEILEDTYKQSKCYLPPEIKKYVNNNGEAIDQIIKLVNELKIKFDGTFEYTPDENIIEFNEKINELINPNKKEVYGIPLIELNSEEKIALQIIRVKNAFGEMIPMLQLSNFNFLKDIINIEDPNILQHEILPNTKYFLSFSFDGLRYKITLIDEYKNKTIIDNIAINNSKLFPTSIGRLTNPNLKDQTFCGTIYDFGITNTFIQPEVYYKFSMINYPINSDLFINFELNNYNNFYSYSKLPSSKLINTNLTNDQIKAIEDEYLNNNQLTTLPYYIYNSYISAYPAIDDEPFIYRNEYTTVVKDSCLSNFSCKNSILHKSFNLSFWFKHIEPIFEYNKEKMIMVSDPKYSNIIYYNKSNNYLTFETKFNSYSIPINININEWYYFSLEFNHLKNEINIYLSNIENNKVEKIFNKTLDKIFDFNLISIFAEFDNISKKFTNFFPGYFGNLILDSKVNNYELLNKNFINTKIQFKGL